MAKTINAFEMAQAQFDHVAEQLKLDPQVSEVLRWPLREFHFRIPVRMDDGTLRVLKASACSTMTPAVLPRVVFAFTRLKP